MSGDNVGLGPAMVQTQVTRNRQIESERNTRIEVSMVA